MDGFATRLKWERSNLGLFYVNRRAQEKVSSRSKRKKVLSCFLSWHFLLTTWKGGSVVAKIASHGFCLEIWLRDALKEVLTFLLITWTHFRNPKVRLGRSGIWPKWFAKLWKCKITWREKRDLTATQEAGFIKIWARDAGLFSCLSGIREIVRSSSKCQSAKACAVVCPVKANYTWLQEINRANRRPTVTSGCQESALGSSIPLNCSSFLHLL